MSDAKPLSPNLPDRVELRDVETYPRMSEGTTAFNATLYLDGNKVAEVENTGKGGPNRYHTFQEAGNDTLLQETRAVAREWLKQEHNEKAAEPLDLLVSELHREQDLQEAADELEGEGFPVTVVVMSDWESWNDDAEPGSLLGGHWAVERIIGVASPEGIDAALEEYDADAYRIVRQ